MAGGSSPAAVLAQLGQLAKAEAAVHHSGGGAEDINSSASFAGAATVFTSEHAAAFGFPDVSATVKQTCVSEVARLLTRAELAAATLDAALDLLKLLSRDPVCQPLLGERSIMAAAAGRALDDSAPEAAALSALKLAMNALITCPAARPLFHEIEGPERLLAGMAPPERFLTRSAEMQTVRLKVLFVATATTPAAMSRVRQDLDGAGVLSAVLLALHAEAVGRQLEAGGKDAAAAAGELPMDIQARLAETLKCLHSFTHQRWPAQGDRMPGALQPMGDLRAGEEFARIAPTLRWILRHPGILDDVVGLCIDLLTNTPHGCYAELLGVAPDAAAIAAATAKPPKASVVTEKHWDPDTPGVVTERVTKVDGEEVEGGGGGAAGAADGDGDSASAGPRKLSEAQFAIVQRILDHMRMQFLQPNKGDLWERVSPSLLVLRAMVIEVPAARRSTKAKVFAKREDLSVGPEAGDSLRALLVKQMISPHAYLKKGVSDFIYQLCNRDLARVVRHVGYGNAAGLMTQLGVASAEPSAGDSDTDSDGETNPEVNPITGRLWEKHDTRELDAMSEAEKEASAMELKAMIDRLNDMGVIKCGLPDGAEARGAERAAEEQRAAEAAAAAEDEAILSTTRTVQSRTVINKD